MDLSKNEFVTKCNEFNLTKMVKKIKKCERCMSLEFCPKHKLEDEMKDKRT